MGQLIETRANPQPKRRRESNMTEYVESLPQNQATHKTSLSTFTQQPVEPVSQLMESPDFSSASSMPANDLDISNLLMAQIGYMQQQLYQDPAASQVNITPTSIPIIDNSGSASNLARRDVQSQLTNRDSCTSDLKMPSLYGSALPTADMKYSNLSAIDDVFNMWSNLPVTFRYAGCPVNNVF